MNPVVIPIALTILLVLLLANACRHYYNMSRILREVSRDLIFLDARNRGVTMTPEEVDTDLREWMEIREELAET